MTSTVRVNDAETLTTEEVARVVFDRSQPLEANTSQLLHALRKCPAPADLGTNLREFIARMENLRAKRPGTRYDNDRPVHLSDLTLERILRNAIQLAAHWGEDTRWLLDRMVRLGKIAEFGDELNSWARTKLSQAIHSNLVAVLTDGD